MFFSSFERRDRADVNEGHVQDAPESCRSRTARSVPARYPMPRQPRSARSSAHALPLRASRRAHRAPHDTRPLPSACSNLSCGTRCRCPLLARPRSTTVRHTRRPLRRPSRAVARSRDARRAARAAASAAATGEEAAALNVGATASAGSELEVGECLYRPYEGGDQNLKSGGVSIAHANLARRVFGNCFWMGTSNRLHQAMVMRGSL